MVLCRTSSYLHGERSRSSDPPRGHPRSALAPRGPRPRPGEPCFHTPSGSLMLPSAGPWPRAWWILLGSHRNTAALSSVVSVKFQSPDRPVVLRSAHPSTSGLPIGSHSCWSPKVSRCSRFLVQVSVSQPLPYPSLPLQQLFGLASLLASA